MEVVSGKKEGVSLVVATLMVVGNMLGSGVFMLPAQLAKIGSISIFGWLLSTVGALALALVFARLASVDPLPGGPYAYARKAFGNYMGFSTNFIYWLASVVGNVGLAVAGLGYLSKLVPSLQGGNVLFFVELCLLWLVIWVNNLGPYVVGKIQSISTIFVLIPIVGVAVFGWFYFNPHTFDAAWNVSGKGSFSDISLSLSMTVWAFIGVESASVAAGVVRNPRRNVPIATVSAVIIVAIVYIVCSSVIMGMIPNKELVVSSAPFSDAISMVFGAKVGTLVTIVAAIGCLGSLIGWTLLAAQSAQSAAKDGLFPKIFTITNARGIPTLGLLIIGLITSFLALITRASQAEDQFAQLLSITVVLMVLPYLYSCIALRVLAHDQEKSKKLIVVDSTMGLVGAIYCIWALQSSDAVVGRWALIFSMVTLVFYGFSHKQVHGGRTTIPKPDYVQRYKKWMNVIALVVTALTLITFYLISVYS